MSPLDLVHELRRVRSKLTAVQTVWRRQEVRFNRESYLTVRGLYRFSHVEKASFGALEA